MDDLPGTRHSLIVKLRDPANSAEWAEFVALYEPLIYRLARRKGLQDADAQDICQEVFRAVARAIERWEPGRGSFRGWLSQITRNLLINFLTRGRQPRGTGATSMQEVLEAHPAGDPNATAMFEAEYERRLFRWAAEEIRHEFAAATWQAFWLTSVEEQTPADVSKTLGLSVGAVYVARSRVLARLKKRIEQLENKTPGTLGEVNNACSVEPL
jgi:RNA polymerase sigma-70 factor (ECF subfamily)